MHLKRNKEYRIKDLYSLTNYKINNFKVQKSIIKNLIPSKVKEEKKIIINLR